jgi:hypothetical protein
MLIWPTAKPAVLTAITILSEAFGAYAFVSAKLPGHTRPDRFVKVTRTGGGQDNQTTDVARLLVECFAKDVGQVENMCNTARAALRNAAGTTVTTTSGEVFVRGWDNENGPTDYPHPEILDYDRWQLTGDLLVKSN